MYTSAELIESYICSIFYLQSRVRDDDDDDDDDMELCSLLI
jgi:hypothetical protein